MKEAAKMKEERREISDYKRLYEMTQSGRIYSLSRKRFMARCEDEYGFHLVKLSKNGEDKNDNVFKLWKSIFKESPKTYFKGAMKAKYK